MHFNSDTLFLHIAHTVGTLYMKFFKSQYVVETREKSWRRFFNILKKKKKFFDFPSILHSLCISVIIFSFCIYYAVVFTELHLHSRVTVFCTVFRYRTEKKVIHFSQFLHRLLLCTVYRTENNNYTKLLYILYWTEICGYVHVWTLESGPVCL